MTRADTGYEGPVPDRLRDAVENQALIFKDTFPGLIGVQITHASAEEVHGTLDVDQRTKHPGGFAHGGALAGFGDTLAAWAVFPSLAEDEIFTTIEFKANFISAVSTGRVRGVARPIHRGGRTMVIDVRIETDEETPRLVCVMLVTQAILKGKPRPG